MILTPPKPSSCRLLDVTTVLLSSYILEESMINSPFATSMFIATYHM